MGVWMKMHKDKWKGVVGLEEWTVFDDNGKLPRLAELNAIWEPLQEKKKGMNKAETGQAPKDDMALPTKKVGNTIFKMSRVLICGGNQDLRLHSQPLILLPELCNWWAEIRIAKSADMQREIEAPKRDVGPREASRREEPDRKGCRLHRSPRRTA
ncbi:uncharacterized protein Z520_11755 [Fonsecaea multimorphosa CBS 102226]|uniref:Uncharacterized protein n=1 Tax=Fonsecaea multimorphosa CBS 102226 TaxID=1442371 RepID=A0A0D2JPZ1_9EURO|nr:uncharacterized protein Z520_11755 [Fonsecaea multimorphosa CBS 102226]KIX92579.1 hypothetical protein Z520_11755 [Fonsecaea multimorphosa CBS 102226]OAL17841.1 hypothetical protein AYO22_11268 [Fonsecaea multimorphosa]